MRTMALALAVTLSAAQGCSAHSRDGRPADESLLVSLPPGVVDGATGRRLAEAGAVVVDVRTPQEFSAGHVPGARNIPHDQIRARAAEIGPAETPVLLYCASGRRSAIAAEELTRLGYRRLWDMQRYGAWPGEPSAQ